MCGIAGYLNCGGRPAALAVLKRMSRVLAHRGPDSDGHWIEGALGLCHRRLAIIDLSDARRSQCSVPTAATFSTTTARSIISASCAASSRRAAGVPLDVGFRSRHQALAEWGEKRSSASTACSPSRSRTVGGRAVAGAATGSASSRFTIANRRHAHVRLGSEGASRPSALWRRRSIPRASSNI